MKMFVRPPNLPFVLLMAALTLSACDQSGKGKKNPPPQGDSGPVAGKTMALKKEVYTFDLGVQEALDALQYNQIPEYALATLNQYTYDSLGRRSREIITAFPQSPHSNLPPGGFIAFDMQFIFSSSEPWKEESSIQELWHAWWDGASLERDRTTTWSGSLEEITTYNSIGNITTQVLEVKEELNELGYPIRVARHTFDDDIPVPEREEIFYRYTDGMQLDRIEGFDWTVEYTYLANGALYSMEIVSSDGSREVTTYDYLTGDGVYLSTAEIINYDWNYNVTRSRTAVEVFERGFCHSAMLQPNSGRPNWDVCKELDYWQ
ncbi:MAG: hypothetical protein NVV73_11670 [Cellvibrionaceae bacterium]|nr:hypothetical protein [Cellvibrionaceae bacterium]